MPISPDDYSVSLALDAGQTSTKGLVLHAEDVIQELVLPAVVTSRPLLPQLVDIVQQAAQQIDTTQAKTPIQAVALGVSGLTPPETNADQLLAMIGDPQLRHIRLTHDSVTSYLGALGTTKGVVIASGTGVVTLAIGEKQVARVDGWGSFMGDAGSGFWVGREVLSAVMRAFDGRGPQTALLSQVQQRWPDLESAYIQLQNDPSAVSAVASFAQAAGELADTDTVAAEICRRAAEELAHSAVTALRRVGQDGPEATPQVAAIGGVFGARPILDEFWNQVQAAVPQAQLSTAAGQGADGAAELFSVEPGHPLRALISVADRTPSH